MKTKAAIIYKAGDPDAFRYKNIELRPPGKDELLIKHTAIGVNYLDTYYRSGLYPVDFPVIVGDEGVGIVEQTGKNVTEFNVGDRIAYPASKCGGYAERRLITASEVVPAPSSIPDEIIAASLLRGMTVEYLVQRLYQIKEGDTILVHAAAGGVGLILCQWAKYLGATVIGTVSSEAKADIAEKHGCDHPIIYTEMDFVEELKTFTNGQLVDVVYDGVGKKTFMKSLDCLRPRGLMVSFGNASGKPEPFDVLELAKKGSLFLTRPTLFEYAHKRSELLAGAKSYFELLEKNVIQVRPGKVFKLSEANKAHQYLENRDKIGAPVLIPD